MKDAGFDAQCAQTVYHTIKAIHLGASLRTGRGVRELFRRSKMREDAVKNQMRALGQLARKTVRVRRQNAQAVHASIHLQLNLDVFLSYLGGGGFKGEELFAAMDRRSKIVLEENLFFARPEAAQHQNRREHACPADFDSLGRGSHAKPIGAGLFQGLGNLRSAVAITIALHNREDFARSLAFFA